MTAVTAEPRTIVDRLLNELTVAATGVGAVMLGTGFFLVWARVASEGLPAQMILSSLPKPFFLQVAFESMLSPLAITAALGTAWTLLATYLMRVRLRVMPAYGWAVFGALLGFVCWLVAQWVNGSAEDESSRAGWWLLLAAVVVGAALSASAGHVVQGLRTPIADTRAWDVVRPLAATTIFLCFFIACTVRVLDAWSTPRALPLVQALVNQPCAQLLGGRAPALPHGAMPDADATKVGNAANARRCEVGGFSLGTSGDWLFLVQRAAGCGAHGSSAPRLVALPRTQLQAVVLLQASDVRAQLSALRCPQH
jgi:hypothetical protein